MDGGWMPLPTHLQRYVTPRHLFPRQFIFIFIFMTPDKKGDALVDRAHTVNPTSNPTKHVSPPVKNKTSTHITTVTKIKKGDGSSNIVPTFLCFPVIESFMT